MGKAKKLFVSRGARSGTLAQQIENENVVKPSFRNKSKKCKEEEEYVDERLSRRILAQARHQQQSLEDGLPVGPGPSISSKTIRLGTSVSDDDEEEDVQSGDEYYEDVEIDEEEEKALEMFMNKDPKPRRLLADIIMEKITEKQTEIHSQLSEGTGIEMQELDPRILQMYEGVRDILTKYRHGKLPKAFKVIPKLRNWEQILYITKPESWSAAAMYQATRIFASNLKDRMAQRFFHLVLYPRIRDDIDYYKRLNFHLYQALRKALFKPGAFMKGILLPLCESGTCTLREAIIVGSVIAKNSIPALHSSAAILKISEMPYTGANSIFLRIFLDKKYALPYRVIDGVVYHFIKFQTDPRELPVLWHQAFLVFVQRYKEDISSEQKEALLELLTRHSHHKITTEIRRELNNSKCRDVEGTPCMDVT